MTLPEEITLRRAVAHRSALSKLSVTLLAAGLRCLLVERVHLTITRSYGPRAYLSPYLEVRNNQRLVATVRVHDRIGKRSHFVMTLPGGLDVQMGEAKDADSLAGYVLQVPGLQQSVDDAATR
ncbi:hypothetical protein GCM10009677_20050 [Sphaerisporangium rubeum]|uniref:Uncharacterized protein n=1 Tax=Sphaerisporangium rubeum TaxID=321317 RepID=A0A7X0IKB4_9ACTN|nr:hypothetical protein [Sphaerisporangium rubeum]MBB6476775.1 hypothetical protein [Sphaerisporangium rubeum]